MGNPSLFYLYCRFFINMQRETATKYKTSKEPKQAINRLKAFKLVVEYHVVRPTGQARFSLRIASL
jgi:hypothetical protein